MSQIVTKGQLQHFVMFWLKPEFNDTEIIAFAEFFESLKSISTIKSLHYGLSAKTPSRPVTDNSFTYSLTIIFDNIEDHNAYQDDPIHLKAIKDFSHNWTKVVVHDTSVV